VRERNSTTNNLEARRARMTIYLVVLMAFLSQAGFGGSRVAVSLHALELMPITSRSDW
jgi:hypothetical protein